MMNYSRTALAASLALVCPVLAESQEWNSTTTFGYSYKSLDNANLEANFYTFDSDGTLSFPSGLAVDYTVIGAIGDFNFDDLDSEIGAISISPTFQVSKEGASVGAYVEYAAFGGNVLLPAVDGTSYGLAGGFGGPGWQAKAFLGTTTSDGVPANVDVWDYGVSLTKDVSEQMHFAARFAASSIDGAASGNAYVWGIAGVYSVSPSVDVFAGAGFGGIDIPGFDGDGYTLGVGASYAFDTNKGVPFIASIEAATGEVNAGLGSLSGTSISVGLTIPIGNNTNKTPLNTVAGSVFQDGYSAFSGAARGLF